MNWIVEFVDRSGPGEEILDHLPLGPSPYHSIATVGHSGKSKVRRAWFQTERNCSKVWLAPDWYRGHFSVTLNDYRLGYFS